MTFNSNQEQYKGSIFNPFVPTKRDIERTDELASKNHIKAGLLGFLSPISACNYLNRASNNLKINIYFLLIMIPIMLTFLGDIRKSSGKLENAEHFHEYVNTINRKYFPKMMGLYVLTSIALMAENTRAVTLARERQSEIN